jgi:hypothetical protein
MKQSIEELFDNFLNKVSSPFIKVEFGDKNSYTKKRLNKTIISRGNIIYLKQEVLKIIKEEGV